MIHICLPEQTGKAHYAFGHYGKNIKGAASSADYIPTVVAYKGDEVCIGHIAKKNITKKGYESYEYFKLRLGSDANTVIENKTKTPTEVTADYIRELLSEYRRVQNIDSIDGVVMTVPETWFREESNRTARENIEKIYEDLGFDIESQFQLESEPVAAAGYFCWAYEQSKEKNPQGDKFNGFITVVDYGGGTLDVTLCFASNNCYLTMYYHVLEIFNPLW